jgi:hypothetical protein
MFKRYDVVETKPTASRLESTVALFLYEEGSRATVLFWLPNARCLYEAMSIDLASVVGPARRVSKAARELFEQHVAGEKRIAAAHGLTLDELHPEVT